MHKPTFALIFMAIVASLIPATLIAEPEVFKLLNAFSAPRGQYGLYQQDSSATVLIKDTHATRQNVFIYLSDLKGGWIDVPALPVRKTKDGHTLFRADNLASYLPKPNTDTYLTGIGDLQFAVRYESNEGTYWDNYYRKNYLMGKNEGHFITVPALQNEASREYLTETAQTRVYGTLLIKNLSYRKKVIVEYTLDNWATAAQVKATYMPVFMYNYTNIDSPNANGVEYWSFEVLVPGQVSNLKYQIRYFMDEKVTVDDNFGEYYSPVPK